VGTSSRSAAESVLADEGTADHRRVPFSVPHRQGDRPDPRRPSAAAGTSPGVARLPSHWIVVRDVALTVSPGGCDNRRERSRELEIVRSSAPSPSDAGHSRSSSDCQRPAREPFRKSTVRTAIAWPGGGDRRMAGGQVRVTALPGTCSEGEIRVSSRTGARLFPSGKRRLNATSRRGGRRGSPEYQQPENS